MAIVENVKDIIEYENWSDRLDRNANGVKNPIEKWKYSFSSDDLRALTSKIDDIITRLNYKSAWYKRTMPDLAAALKVDSIDLESILKIIYENRSVSYDNYYREPNWVKSNDNDHVHA